MSGWRAVVWLAAALGASCDVPREGREVQWVVSGQYMSRGAERANSALPHGDEHKSMVIDREAGTVRIEYERDGRRVVETWRIAESMRMWTE